METTPQRVKMAFINHLDKAGRSKGGSQQISLYDADESNLSILLDFVKHVVLLDDFLPTIDQLRVISENNPGISLKFLLHDGTGGGIRINIKTININCIRKVCSKPDDTDEIDKLFCSIEEQSVGCNDNFLTVTSI